MSYKSQLFPLSSTAEVSPRVAVPQDLKFLRFRVVCSSDVPNNVGVSPRQRKVAVGLALAFGVSTGFWIGVVLIVARIWR